MTAWTLWKMDRFPQLKVDKTESRVWFVTVMVWETLQKSQVKMEIVIHTFILSILNMILSVTVQINCG